MLFLFDHFRLDTIQNFLKLLNNLLLVFSIALRSADENSKSEQLKEESEETNTEFIKNLPVPSNENAINPQIDENIMKTKAPSKTDDEVVAR